MRVSDSLQIAFEQTRRFKEWYLQELFLSMPRFASSIYEPPRKRIVFQEIQSKFVFPEHGIEDISLNENACSNFDDALETRGLSRERLRFELELPHALFLQLRFDISAKGLPDLHPIICSRIKAKTPLHIDEIVYDYRILQSNEEKLSVEVSILKKDVIERALEATPVCYEDIEVVHSTKECQKEISITIMHRKPRWSNSFRFLLACCILAVLLGAAGFSTHFYKNSLLIASLDQEMASAAVDARLVQKSIDEATRQSSMIVSLRQERKRLKLFVDLWEEIAHLLPDDAYVVKLRMMHEGQNNRRIELIGFAGSAAEMPRIFEGSPLFRNASLMSSITPNPIIKREGFALRTAIE